MSDNSFTPVEQKKSNRRLLLWFLLALLIALLPWLVLAQDSIEKKKNSPSTGNPRTISVKHRQ